MAELKEKILIIGQGVISSFMGITLKQNGYTVQHLVRNQKVNSLNIQCRDRRKTNKLKKGTSYHYQFLDSKTEISQFNIIIIPVAHYHLRQAILDLKPYIITEQTIIISGNVWNDFDWISSQLKNPIVYAFPNFGGAIVNGKLQGWLTPNFTVGIIDKKILREQSNFVTILRNAGFNPKSETDIDHWLRTHFAYNAGMLLAATKYNGFATLTKKIARIKEMYRLMREQMMITNKLGTPTNQYPEWREVNKSLLINALKMYVVFLLPGIAKAADANKNLKDWTSYAHLIFKDAQAHEIEMPLTRTYKHLLDG